MVVPTTTQAAGKPAHLISWINLMPFIAHATPLTAVSLKLSASSQQPAANSQYGRPAHS
jgi:hypothetical protein